MISWCRQPTNMNTNDRNKMERTRESNGWHFHICVSNIIWNEYDRVVCSIFSIRSKCQRKKSFTYTRCRFSRAQNMVIKCAHSCCHSPLLPPFFGIFFLRKPQKPIGDGCSLAIWPEFNGPMQPHEEYEMHCIALNMNIIIECDGAWPRVRHNRRHTLTYIVFAPRKKISPRKQCRMNCTPSPAQNTK